MSTAVLKYSDVVGTHVKQEVTFDGQRKIHRVWVDGVKGRGATWTEGAAPAEWILPYSVTTHLTALERTGALAGVAVPAVLRRLQVLRQDEIESRASQAAAVEEPVEAVEEIEEVVSQGDVSDDNPAESLAQMFEAAIDMDAAVDALAAKEAEADVPAVVIEDASPKETVSEFVVPTPVLITKHSEAEQAVLDNTHGQGLDALVPQDITPWELRSDGINGVNEFTVADGARADHDNIRLYGPTGTGKTHFARACAARWGVPFLIFSGSASGDVETLIGYDQIIGGDTKFIQGLLLLAMNHPSGAVVCLDEINFFRPDILTPLFPLLDDARAITVPGASGGQVFKAQPLFTAVATMNPGDYAGTVELNEALKRRFKIRADWGYDSQVESKLLTSQSLQEIANKMRANKTEVFSDIATPTLVEFERYVPKYGLQFATSNFVANFDREQERQIARDLFTTYRHNLAEDFGVSADLADKQAAADFEDLDI